MNIKWNIKWLLLIKDARCLERTWIAFLTFSCNASCCSLSSLFAFHSSHMRRGVFFSLIAVNKCTISVSCDWVQGINHRYSTFPDLWLPTGTLDTRAPLSFNEKRRLRFNVFAFYYFIRHARRVSRWKPPLVAPQRSLRGCCGHTPGPVWSF